MQKFDVVIVGSGLGGLLCGVMLGKEGYNVCIVEKHHQIGGCLQTFERDGCIFDTGMHYIGSMDEGQILNRYFKYFGLTDKLKLRKLNTDGFDVINYLGKEYKFAMGYEGFIETMAGYFPAEREGIVQYINKLKEISRSLNLYNLREVDTFNFVEADYITDSTHGFIASITKDKKLQNVLAGLNSLYAGFPNKTPLYLHALINNFFIESAWRMVDGSSQMADILANSIREMGGTILTRSKVNKFVFENDELTSVNLASGEQIGAKYFISGIHPENTLSMVDTPKIRNAYRNRICTLENTISVFSIYIVLKENSFPYLNYNYYYGRKNTTWLTETYTPEGGPDGYMMFTPATSKSEKYADCMTAICYMNYDEVKQWEGTSIERRGQEYKDLKHKKAEKLLDLLEVSFPDIRKCIKKYYTSTPLTYRDYTGTKEGSLYGFMKDCNDPIKSYIPPRTKIPNLFLTGQNINLHGVLGVTIGSLLTCAELCGLNYLIRKINNT